MGRAVFDFSGEAVLITGTGRGFGRVCSVAFARAGARVAMCDVDDQGGEETLALVREAGGEGFYVNADVSDEEQVAAFVEETVARYGGLDVAVNNACAEVPGPTLDLPSSTFAELIDTNLKASTTGSSTRSPPCGSPAVGRS